MSDVRRIVSLLPSTTEICFALGVGDRVVGRTFECDHPSAAHRIPVVSTTTMPASVSAAGSAAIDAWVSDAVARGEDLYRLDAGALRSIDPDLVLTQDLCAVCAVDVASVDDALTHLGCTADVLTLDPRTLEEVLASIATVADRTGVAAAGAALVATLRERLDVVRRRVRGRTRPRVAVLEWTDPPYAPGHWLPEQVDAAGGDPVLGRAGERSVRVTWEDVSTCRPDVVVCAPCGFDLAAARTLAEQARAQLPDVPVWAVDADGCFARPGPRLVDGVETLAGILHPDGRPPAGALRVGRGTRAGPGG
ncbi:cobalamin-binding protein [Marmoricola endophyticus]|uniref:Cobalamin-binding protein n=1 Tax=Marmoricola endophyticus TaxID=2040280 RepID=A0A917BFW8_9ACTN|nr:ABC transporter substrate-binding protein [Marmoricola endophyticus]GGF42108.1 cobalamin-binding protein [Marmoricola endophyticus]